MIISEAEIKSPLTLVDNTEKIKELKEEEKELKAHLPYCYQPEGVEERIFEINHSIKILEGKK
jgi:hypothetical protein